MHQISIRDTPVSENRATEQNAKGAFRHMQFDGTNSYITTDDLKIAVNAAIHLERPLLIKGEPGTGKTVLAHEVATALATPMIEWHIKSTIKGPPGELKARLALLLRKIQGWREKLGVTRRDS